MLQIIPEMKGCPSSTWIREEDIPKVVQFVEEEITNMLVPPGKKPLKFAVAMDGGSAALALGQKVVAVTALSPELPYDLLLSVNVRVAHETAQYQADVLQDTAARLKFDKRNVEYLVGDNASVNKSTVKLLVALGWVPTYVRCLPHCLNLVLVAFLGAFDAVFHMTTFLKSVRSFVKAGGTSSRKATLLEWALSLAQIDFGDTRWESLCSTIKYLMSDQSKREMKKANKRLKQLAEEGDDSAAAALQAGENDEPDLHWRALHGAIESMEVDAEGEC